MSIVFVCMLFVFTKANAQLLDTIDFSLNKKPKFFFTFANHNTFIDHQYANVNGTRLGVSFNRRVRFGVGFFNLVNNSIVTTIPIKENDQEYTTEGQLSFSFIAFSAEYFYYNKYPWQFGVMPFNIGIGQAHYDYINRPQGIRVSTEHETIVLYQPEFSGQYSIFRWIGVGTAIGYRLILYREHKVNTDLNAPMFSFDIRLFLDEIYNMIFKKDKKD
jgi:hypothetical protein